MNGKTGRLADIMGSCLAMGTDFFEKGSSIRLPESVGQTVRTQRFIHGFVLWMMAELEEMYEILCDSENECCEVSLIPKRKRNTKGAKRTNNTKSTSQGQDPPILMEFKVQTPEEQNLNNACRRALMQLREKDGLAAFQEREIDIASVLCYGIAFHGNDVEVQCLKGDQLMPGTK